MKRTAVVSILLFVVLVASCAAPDATPTPAPVPTISSRSASFVTVEDDVQARGSETAEFAAAQAGQEMQVGGQARTGEPGKARLDLAPEGTIVRLGPGSLFTLAELQSEADGPFSKLRLAAGQLWIILNGGSLEVETDIGIASVRGSLMGVFFHPQGVLMTATCLEGNCSLSNDLGTTEFTAGQASDIVGADQPPSAARPMSQQEYQDWLDNNPEAAGLPAPAVFGVQPAAPQTPLDPNVPWPPPPTAFQAVYPDPSGDTENCFSPSQKIADPAADILSTTIYYDGGGFLIADILVAEYSDTEYEVYITFYWETSPSMADYLADIEAGGVTLIKQNSPGVQIDYAAGEMFLTGRAADGRRIFRFVVARAADQLDSFIVSLYHTMPSPKVCDHQAQSIH